MRGAVAAACTSADYSPSRVSQLIGQFLDLLHAVMCGAPRADDTDCVMIALLQLAPNVEHDRRRMDFAQRLGICRGFLGNHRHLKFANACKLRCKIDS